MLTEKEAEEKLRGMAQEFQDLMKQRQYGIGKILHVSLYNPVAFQQRVLAVTMELSEDIKEELFGVRGGKGEILRNGAFPEELVQKALYEASVRNT